MRCSVSKFEYVVMTHRFDVNILIKHFYNILNRPSFHCQILNSHENLKYTKSIYISNDKAEYYEKIVSVKFTSRLDSQPLISELHCSRFRNKLVSLVF